MAFLDRVVDTVDQVTRFPGKVSRRADRLNDKFIEWAEQVDNALGDSASAAERNLTRNKIASIGRSAADWISNPDNLFLAGLSAGVLFIVFTFIIRK